MNETPVAISDHLAIERNSPVPLYHQIAEQLQEAIQAGRLQPGQRIENELDLARELVLSRPTIRQAIDVLVRKGLLVRRRGIGTQVANNIVSRQVELSSLYEDLTKFGMAPSTRVLKFQRVPAGAELAQIFRIRPDDELVYIERLRLAKAEPLAIMKNWIPPKLVHFSSEQLRHDSLYRLLRTSGYCPKVANQRFSAAPATGEYAMLLRVEPGTPLLSMTRTSFDVAGHPIEHADHLYLANAYAVEVTVTAQ